MPRNDCERGGRKALKGRFFGLNNKIIIIIIIIIIIMTIIITIVIIIIIILLYSVNTAYTNS